MLLFAFWTYDRINLNYFYCYQGYGVASLAFKSQHMTTFLNEQKLH